MIKLKILYYPDKRLRIIAKPVIRINKYTKNIIEEMFKIMYKHKGIGLAATQININKQIIVIDISKKKNKKIVLINPQILKSSGKVNSYEGCLSIPNYYNYITRYKKIRIKTKNMKNNYYEFEADNLLSTCIQHEIDHLIGKLFIDYLYLKKFV